MNLFSRKAPWFAAGLAFECAQCGRCCAGPEEGYVWVTEDEIVQIAAQLGILPEQMRRSYLRRVGANYTIIEQPQTNDCMFLQSDAQGNRRCTIYQVRPRQCRTWPFWRSNLASPRDWAVAGTRCKGINRGRLFDLEEILERAKPPRE